MPLSILYTTLQMGGLFPFLTLGASFPSTCFREVLMCCLRLLRPCMRGHPPCLISLHMGCVLLAFALFHWSLMFHHLILQSVIPCVSLSSAPCGECKWPTSWHGSAASELPVDVLCRSLSLGLRPSYWPGF